MSTPLELCSLQKCLDSTDVAYFEYSGVRYMFLPLDVCYFSETPQVRGTSTLATVTRDVGSGSTKFTTVYM